jgi:hypothetical protein
MSSSSRKALSVVEVLVCLVILAFALVPINNLFMSSNRIGHSARRLVDASMYGQTILEGVSMLEPADLPAIAPGSELILLDGAVAAPGGGPKFREIANYFNTAQPFPMQERTVTALRADTGELLLKIELKWLGVVSDERTLQTANLQMLTPPKSWR